MKILDKYILKQFLRNFLFGILSFLLIFILVDLFENLDKFIDNNLTKQLIFLYYLYFIPEILKLITPVGMLMASLFTTSRFNTYSEMTAINSSGISIYRYSLSMIVFAVILTLFSLYFNGWIVPKSNSAKLNFERSYMNKNKIPGSIQNLHIQDTENHIISIGNYNETDKSGYNVSVQIFDSLNLSKLNYRFDAKNMKWDSIKNEWKLFGVSKREFDSTLSVKYAYFDTAYISYLPEINRIYVSPSQLRKKQLKPDELLISDLKEYIDSMEESGLNVSKAKVDYYSKISFPFANIIVILFGISISSNRRKSGTAIQFGISILVTFVYLGFLKVSQTFGYSGDINPVLTAWLANIIFLIVALLNLVRVSIFGR
ncbi:MAG: LptF/LptG family permease [Ignavibacteria bacterium]|nr:LptF/LptG family permease [Ignavibacteria bacterium]